MDPEDAVLSRENVILLVGSLASGLMMVMGIYGFYFWF